MIGGMDVLVLGGTHHVGRSVVEAALDRGDTVTTLNRGLSGGPAPGVEGLYADRTDTAQVAEAVRGRSWDVVIDTWSGAPRAVRDAAGLLGDRAAHYTYVSSRSVYRWPIPVGLDERGPVVDGDAESLDTADYAAVKRGGELGAQRGFGERTLVARPGLILGPYERVGRLPWWLRRMERGGRVLAPGPPERPLQYIDGRDLAQWMLTAAEAGLSGVYDTVSRPGHATMGELLDAVKIATGSDAELVWVSPEIVEGAGIAAWTELPIWVPPQGDLAGLHAGDVTAALQQGLRCRPIGETVTDTWAWLQAEGDPSSLANGSVGLSAEREAEVLQEMLP
jgi:2'-hydroxyisoflavone reductase